MKNKILILLCVCNLQYFCQSVLGVDTVMMSGPINKRINLVIMGDGYTASQMPLFINNATTVANYLLNTPPFNSYKNYFNVFAIKCASPQSGVSHPGTATDVTEPVIPVSSVSNFFNTRFDNNNIHRLIYSNNSAAVYSVLATNFPAYDQVLILGNSPEYGGAGGAYAVSSTNAASSEIVAHEMGHSFAGLADEYWAGASYAAEKPNMTANANIPTVKWTQWIGLNGIGLYPYDTISPASNWYRPHQNCKMRYLSVPYCSVCKQTIIEKIHTLTNPIDAYAPANAGLYTYTAAAEWFKTSLVKPAPNTLKSSWQLNAVQIAANADSVLVASSSFTEGVNNLLFTVSDTTAASKDINHATLHTYSVLWKIDYTTTGIKEIKAQLEFSIFPNPTADLLHLNYNLLEDSEVGLSVIDMSGKTLIAERSRSTAAGEYKKEIDVSALPGGNYILALKINGKTINNKFIISK